MPRSTKVATKKAKASLTFKASTLMAQPVINVPPRTKESSTPQEDQVVDPSPKEVPYNLLDLGGAREQLQEILSARPQWDEETVEEILRWGGKPKLHKVHNTYDGGRFTKVRCTFVHPSGKLVEGVWLPLSILKAEYASRVSHLK